MVSDKAGPVVVKPALDKRQYEVLRLRNGLSALLISDPEIKAAHNSDLEMCPTSASASEDGDASDDDYEVESEDDEEDDEEDDGNDQPSAKKKKRQIKKAAAALCVSVGSFSDPPDAPGLAHLLEHMLFMGSTKFPEENEYDSFLAEHGGSSNACTDMERTLFNFDVNHLYLKPALDRFSQFFVSPLVKMDSLEREVKAVDSEFVQALQNDSSRLEQLMCSTANALHPYNRFAWGNEKSLTDAIRKCGDIRSKLVDFYKQHYQAQRMTLVVLGGEPVEILREWVTELFQDVAEGSSKAPKFITTVRPWSPGKLYRVESVRDQHCLDLSWPLPCLDDLYLKRPEDYIQHLIGHEGSGSFLKFLKAKGWASGLSADTDENGIEQTTAGCVLTVEIELTLLGLEKVFEIIGHFYEYIRMIKEKRPQKWVFDELQAVDFMDFRFLEEEPAESYTTKLAENMHFYPPEHIVYGDYACEQWDPKLVDDLLELINPENMRTDLVTKNFDREATGVLIEPWFGVPYTVEEIPKDLLRSWSKPGKNTIFHLPPINDFIPRDFSIRAASDGQGLPSILLEEPSLKVWYKHDQTFERPKANVHALISCKMDTARSEVLVQLYVMLLRDALNEIMYMATVARSGSAIFSSAYAIEIKIHGFSEKLQVLTEKISELLKSFTPQEDRFQAMKEQVGQDYRNACLKPLTHASSLRRELLLEPSFSDDARLECLSSISLEDVKSFIPQIFAEAKLEVLCHGNLSNQEARDIVEILKSSILFKNTLERTRPQQTNRKLPANTCLVHNVYVQNKLEKNSAVEMYYQLEQDWGVAESIRHRALVELFEHIADEPFYNQLRTEEQLGYRVECGSRSTNGIIGFCFRVQSSEYHPDYLRKRIDAFVERFLDLLKDMPDEEFQRYKDSLIAEKLEKDTCLSEETDRYWEHILDQRYVFEEPKRLAVVLKDLTKKNLLGWFKEYIWVGGSRRRSLCIQVWGSKFKDEFSNKSVRQHRNKKQKKQVSTTIENVKVFKDKAEFYPLFHHK